MKLWFSEFKTAKQHPNNAYCSIMKVMSVIVGELEKRVLVLL